MVVRTASMRVMASFLLAHGGQVHGTRRVVGAICEMLRGVAWPPAAPRRAGSRQDANPGMSCRTPELRGYGATAYLPEYVDTKPANGRILCWADRRRGSNQR